MTANTSNRGYRYPQSTDHDRLWEHYQNLATDIDEDVNNIVERPRFVGTFSATIANNSITTLTPAAVLVNVGGMWTSGTDITIPAGQDGEYEVGVLLRYASQATPSGQRHGRIHVNGSEYMTFLESAVSNTAATNIVCSGVIPLVLAGGDTVSFAGYQTSGGSLGIVGNSRGWVRKVVQ